MSAATVSLLFWLFPLATHAHTLLSFQNDISREWVRELCVAYLVLLSENELNCICAERDSCMSFLIFPDLITLERDGWHQLCDDLSVKSSTVSVLPMRKKATTNTSSVTSSLDRRVRSSSSSFTTSKYSCRYTSDRKEKGHTISVRQIVTSHFNSSASRVVQIKLFSETKQKNN